jgi:predicted MFS family arabinose efflux permease
MNKPLVFLIAVTVLSHAGFVGSRITVSLDAIGMQASTFTVGLLVSLYGLVPMFIAVQAGRLLDRIGIYRPLLITSATLAGGILLPAAWPGLPALHVASVVIGTSFMLQHIGLNHLVGFIGDPAKRAANFSWLALGYAISGFLGPLLAGFAIDLVGHRWAFAIEAVPATGALALLLWRRPPQPGLAARKAGEDDRSVLDLLRIPSLRSAFLFSGLIATGWDLYSFVIPLYGSRIGLSASTIGIVMSSFALATFAVRLAMPVLSRRLNEWTIICAALVVSGVAYLLFPLVESAPFLIALSFLLGLGIGASQPMIMALLYAASPPGRQGEAVGVRTTLQNASHVVIPLLFGALGATLGIGTIFLTMAAMLLGGGWHSRKHL